MKVNWKVIYRWICWWEGLKKTIKTGVYDAIRMGWINNGHQFGAEKGKDDAGMHDDWVCKICGYVSKGTKNKK